ncbi:MAG: hypothetical protein H6668_17375 [Ardenticatenaceae bacterium]|nr:hypothetical protein [Ardenticatenaceae bacterium]
MVEQRHDTTGYWRQPRRKHGGNHQSAPSPTQQGVGSSPAATPMLANRAQTMLADGPATLMRPITAFGSPRVLLAHPEVDTAIWAPTARATLTAKMWRCLPTNGRFLPPPRLELHRRFDQHGQNWQQHVEKMGRRFT